VASFSITADVLLLQPVISSLTVAADVTQTERQPQMRAADLELALGTLHSLLVQAVVTQTAREPRQRLAGPVVALGVDSGDSPDPIEPVNLLPRWRRPSRIIPS
jgi:hypothetical protein